MGILKITEQLHDQLRMTSKAFDRSLNGQAEHWMKIGMLCELHQELNYKQIIQLLLQEDDLSFQIKKKKSKK